MLDALVLLRLCGLRATVYYPLTVPRFNTSSEQMVRAP